VNYVDANFAVLHVTINSQTPIAERYVRKNRLLFVFSESGAGVGLHEIYPDLTAQEKTRLRRG